MSEERSNSQSNGQARPERRSGPPSQSRGSYGQGRSSSGGPGGQRSSGPGGQRSGGYQSRRRFNDSDGGPGGGRGGRFQRRRKVCSFCLEKTDAIDYKDLAMLRRFVTERGKIRSRRKTGTCAKHQRRLAMAVKRARHIALVPYTAEHIRQY